jgi:hypothetical protein
MSRTGSNMTNTRQQEAVAPQSKTLNKKSPLDKSSLNGKTISIFIHL